MQTKEEIAAYQRAYYEDNKVELTAKQQIYNEANKVKIAAKKKEYRDKRNLMLFEYKGGACQHCKVCEPDQLEIYDYHHTEPTTKLYSIGYILVGSLERLMAEVDKCLLLCSNCHRKEHARLNKKEVEQ